MFNQFRSKFKQQLRYVLLSMAEKLDSDRPSSPPVTEEKPKRSRRNRRKERNKEEKKLFRDLLRNLTEKKENFGKYWEFDLEKVDYTPSIMR